MAGLASDVELWHRFPGNHRDLLTGAGPKIWGVANKSRTDRDVWLRPRNRRVANAECRRPDWEYYMMDQPIEYPFPVLR
jgi:hypothetical protein